MRISDWSSDVCSSDLLAERPALSINRGFSAPVSVEPVRSAADLALLSAHDAYSCARYEAMQQLMLDTLVAAVPHGRADHGAVIAAVRETLADATLDAAFIGEAVLLPSENFIGDQLAVVEPEAIFRARATLRRDLGTALEPLWRAAYADNAAEHYAYTPAAKGRRRLRNVALDYIAAADPQAGAALAFAQFEGTDNKIRRAHV